WDYLISPNEYSTEIFKSAFQFNKTMIESGYPRNDFLFTHNNKDDINTIKNKLQLPKDKKIILYAPTWRDDDLDRKSTRLNSSHVSTSYAVFCLKKKTINAKRK